MILSDLSGLLIAGCVLSLVQREREVECERSDLP